MQMNNYPLGVVVARLAAAGFTNLLLHSEQHGRFLTVSIMGRAPTTAAD
jgi:hypothetical protein